MCYLGGIRNQWVGFKCAHPQTRGPFTFQLTAWKSTKNGKCHTITVENTLTGCEVMPQTIAQLSPKPQMIERRLSTICVVVERPDHHCSHDLVFLPRTTGASNVKIYQLIALDSVNIQLEMTSTATCTFGPPQIALIYVCVAVFQ